MLSELVRPRRGDGRGAVVCIANQKGGVAKTTTAVNAAAALALRGHRVLVVDLDPQGNATTGLGVARGDRAPTSYELLVEEAPLAGVVRPTAIRGLDCAPASVDLAGAEVELVAHVAREEKLRAAIAGHPYDLVFVDCPPSLGLLTVNALVAADDLIVPVQCEYYALEGLGQLVDTAGRVRAVLNPRLRITGFVMTMYDARTRLAGQVVADVRGHFPDVTFRTVIPRSVRLSEAPSFGEPALTLDPSSKGALAYRLLGVEIEEAYGLPRHVPPPPGPTAAPEPPATTPETGPRPAAGPRPGSPPSRPERGPGGRGYGTVAPEPPGLDDAHPRPAPWTRP